jgi:CHAD domain-containing protein
MLRVLEECENVSAGFAPDPVHDLRVSLRRCRSLADGLMALDPDPNWKAMKKAGKRLFQRLGALRDIHVMMEWVEKLSVERAQTSSKPEKDTGNGEDTSVEQNAADPAVQAFLEILHRREEEQKVEAHAALEEFDRKLWRQWSKSLPRCAARFRLGSALFRHLALERWTEARELHARALRNRSQTSFHSLRIGIKRFRYIVENFLPAEHRAWSNDLKEMQDALGEVHDLDVLWATALACRVFPDEHSRRSWHEQIVSERAARVERYHAKMTGPDSLWQTWRARLPEGRQIQLLATRRMKLWASGLDPDFPHSERVTNLALQLYDSLLASGWKPSIDATTARSSLFAAALLHDVGKSEGEKGHHKTSCELICAHGSPLGWNAADLRRAGIVARFHRGALPTRRHKLLRDLLPDEEKAVVQLAAILRLANAFDAGHDGHIRRVQVENVQTENVRMRTKEKQALIISAEGYASAGKSAQNIAAERHLLEIVLRRPIIVKSARPETRTEAPRRPRAASRQIR